MSDVQAGLVLDGWNADWLDVHGCSGGLVRLCCVGVERGWGGCGGLRGTLLGPEGVSVLPWRSWEPSGAGVPGGSVADRVICVVELPVCAGGPRGVGGAVCILRTAQWTRASLWSSY